MALQADNKWYCKVTHYENDRVVTRRINSIIIQAVDGRLYTLTEKKLPDAISLYTGIAHRGEHMAEVLMNPTPRVDLKELAGGWPSGRDLFNIVMGSFLCFVLVVSVRAFRFFFDM